MCSPIGFPDNQNVIPVSCLLVLHTSVSRWWMLFQQLTVKANFLAQLQAIFSGLWGLADTLRFRGVAWWDWRLWLQRKYILYIYMNTQGNPVPTDVPLLEAAFHFMLSHELLSQCPNTHSTRCFIGLTTHKLSLKHIYFPNITSRSP